MYLFNVNESWKREREEKEGFQKTLCCGERERKSEKGNVKGEEIEKAREE